jgi:hypothetical protein
MRYLLLLFLFAINCFRSYAQHHEISFGLGMANYIGDLSPKHNTESPFNFLNSQNIKASYTLGYKYNFEEFFSIGINASFMNVSAYDSDNADVKQYNDAFFRYIRNLSFYSDITEVNAMVGFEPFRNFNNWNNDKILISPIISAGIGFFSFDPKASYNGQEVSLRTLSTEGQGLTGGPSKYSTTAFSFPIGLGVKAYFPQRNFWIGLEGVYRYTSTDYLDDVSTSYYSDPTFSGTSTPALSAALAQRRLEIDPNNIYDYVTAPGQQRGDKNNNDVFWTLQLKIGYNLFPTSGKNYGCYKIR